MVLSSHRDFQQSLSGKYAKVACKLSPRSSILEVGCNTGYFSRFLIDSGYKVLGVERDEEAAKAARERGVPLNFSDIEDPETLSSIEDTFDVVLLMDVLEHLRNPIEVLKKLKIVLNKNGKILITGPNVAYWSIRKDLLLGRWNYKDAGILDRNHLHFYTASTWKSLVEEGGYEITAFEPAEGMIPLEHILCKIPVISLITPVLLKTALRLMPGFFTIVYLIEAVPSKN